MEELYLTPKGERRLKHLSETMGPEQGDLDWMILNIIDKEGSVQPILENVPPDLQAATRTRTRVLFEARYIERK